ncbi:MAG TPA: aldose epimerase family protein [Verrucomicrobiae bacterium]|nr:aldose epimerase family protein [Verrucomicrobiae bacterium]
MSKTNGSINKAIFGKMPDGAPVEIYTLRNGNGMESQIMTLGGTVTSLKTPDKNGRLDDVVLGYEALDGYLKNNPYFGGLIGRYGNRIGGAEFILDGKTCVLAKNHGLNSLHGGVKGFDKVIWKTIRAEAGADGPQLELYYLSKDGEEGFPGNLDVTAIYTLTEDNALRLNFSAVTDKPTLCNLTHHSYFNLAGRGDILGHEVFINADKFTPVNESLIPTGELKSLDGTPLDFRRPTAIGARIDSDDEQLKFGRGYDHNWVINKPAGELGLVARTTEAATGRILEVFSTEPGLQFYSGNFLDGSITGKGGTIYKRRHGFCMEPQHFPDSPNKPNFPSAVLRPGQVYRNTIICKFSTG